MTATPTASIGRGGRNYFCGFIPTVKPLFEWAEGFGKVQIVQTNVELLRPNFEEDPVIISHLMWNYFDASLLGAAKEIFDNVDMYQGLEVWRKISQKINVGGERRRDELAEVVNSPKFTGAGRTQAIANTWPSEGEHCWRTIDRGLSRRSSRKSS